MIELARVDFDDAVDHVVEVREPSERPWWTALHSVLLSPESLTPDERGALPRTLQDALVTGGDFLEAWLDAPEITDRIWATGCHCPLERHLVARLVTAAAASHTPEIAEFLGRDLQRLSAITSGPWGCEIDAMHRLAETSAFLTSTGVPVGAFFDIHDALAQSPAGIEIDACFDAAVYLPDRSAAVDSVATVTPGSFLVIDADGLYDRLVVKVATVDNTVLTGTDLASGLLCRIDLSTRPRLTSKASESISWTT